MKKTLISLAVAIAAVAVYAANTIRIGSSYEVAMFGETLNDDTQFNTSIIDSNLNRQLLSISTNSTEWTPPTVTGPFWLRVKNLNSTASSNDVLWGSDGTNFPNCLPPGAATFLIHNANSVHIMCATNTGLASVLAVDR